MTVALTASGLRKTFNRRMIFDGVTFEARSGNTVLISGKNGSGKSTLVKLLTRVLTPSAGAIALSAEGCVIPEIHWPLHVGLVSPYMQVYDEFSARENLDLALTLRGLPPDAARVAELLDDVGLTDRSDDPLRTFSSGMKQRIKLAFALIHNPAVLFLDEPMTNLDAAGIALVRRVMQRQREQGILVVATNDQTDVDAFETKVDLDARP